MKKWIGFSLLAIFLSIAGWLTYTFFIKDYEIADQEVDKIVDDDFDIELPEDTVSKDNSTSSEENNINKKESTNKTEGNTESSTPDSQDTESSSNSTSKRNSADSTGQKSTNSSNENNESEQSTVDQDQKDTSQNTSETSNPSSNKEEEQKDTSEETKSTENSQADTLTVQQIKNKYKPSFNALQQQAQSKLSGLISYAYNEYKRKKENGEKVSYGYFYNKYTNAADRLEAKTDSSFNQLYSSMQNMLVQNGHSKDAASEVKAYYEEQKKAREDALMNKVLKNF